MRNTDRTLNQGTTLMWTEHYGDVRSLTARVEQAMADVFFAATLAVFLAGVVGFVTHEPTAARLAASQPAARAL